MTPGQELTPVEEYEQQLERRTQQRWITIRLCAVAWLLTQCYAAADYLLAHWLLVGYGADEAFATALIWTASVPWGIGAGLLALVGPPGLSRRRLLLSALPWIVTTLQASVALWLLYGD